MYCLGISELILPIINKLGMYFLFNMFIISMHRFNIWLAVPEVMYSSTYPCVLKVIPYPYQREQVLNNNNNINKITVANKIIPEFVNSSLMALTKITLLPCCRVHLLRYINYSIVSYKNVYECVGEMSNNMMYRRVYITWLITDLNRKMAGFNTSRPCLYVLLKTNPPFSVLWWYMLKTSLLYAWKKQLCRPQLYKINWQDFRLVPSLENFLPKTTQCHPHAIQLRTSLVWT